MKTEEQFLDELFAWGRWLLIQRDWEETIWAWLRNDL